MSQRGQILHNSFLDPTENVDLPRNEITVVIFHFHIPVMRDIMHVTE